MTAAPAVPTLGRASRAARLVLSLALIGGAVAFALLLPPTHAKPAPSAVAAAAATVPVVAHPSTRVPGPLVIPKPKRAKKVVKQAPTTSAASTATAQTVTPVVNSAPVVASKPKTSSSSGSSSGASQGTEFGPG